MNLDLSKIPTPCFVLNEQLLEQNLQLLQRVQQEAGVDIILALKGFAMFSTFETVRKYLAGATASSLNEALLCVEEMKSLAHVCAPAYIPEKFPALIDCASHITFNSLKQWQQFKSQVDKNNKIIKCALRINPEYSEVETELYNPCVAGSRLGIRRKELGDNLPEGITGLHFHSLCENDSFTLERTLNAIENQYDNLLHQAEWINMGGGHLMTKEGYDIEHLIELLTRFKSKYNLKIIMEPGGAVAWQTGYLVTSVLDIFDSEGIMAVILDTSIANHLPDCLEMPYTPAIYGSKIIENSKNKETAYRLGGMTCLAGDYVGDYHFDKPLQIGDKLVFMDMMHYTMVKTNTFNGVSLPSIGIWKKNNTFEMIKVFDYQDYKNRLS